MKYSELLAAHEAKQKPRPRVPNLAGHADVAPLYTPEDLRSFDYERDLGYPGMPPFTRGVQPNMYRGRHWTSAASARSDAWASPSTRSTTCAPS